MMMMKISLTKMRTTICLHFANRKGGEKNDQRWPFNLHVISWSNWEVVNIPSSFIAWWCHGNPLLPSLWSSSTHFLKRHKYVVVPYPFFHYFTFPFAHLQRPWFSEISNLCIKARKSKKSLCKRCLYVCILSTYIDNSMSCSHTQRMNGEKDMKVMGADVCELSCDRVRLIKNLSICDNFNSAFTLTPSEIVFKT